MTRTILTLSGAILLLASCQAPTGDQSASSESMSDAADSQEMSAPAEESAEQSDTEVAAMEAEGNRPDAVNSCPMGKNNADVWGYFRDPNRSGVYAEYCFKFNRDGTFVYSDYVDRATGTWSRDGSTVEWSAKNRPGEDGYVWTDVTIPISGELKGVEFSENGVPVAHESLMWRARNTYGRNNIRWDLEGLPQKTWSPAS